MGKYSKKRLPKGFRYLFTSKEVKEIEEKSELNFNWVSNGNVGNSEKFNTENTIQSNFRAFSIHSKKNEGKWEFHLYQSGFRNELLPESLEGKTKLIIKNRIVEFLKKIYNSMETEFYKNPQLWGNVMIIENEIKMEWTEFK